MPLPRNWDIGVRSQYQSGTPTTDHGGYNAARGDGYLRFDLRVDKRAVWRKWLLDFYVDITNVALLPEEIHAGHGDSLRAADGGPARAASDQETNTMNNGNAIDTQVLDLMLRAGSQLGALPAAGAQRGGGGGDARAAVVLLQERRPARRLGGALAALRDGGAGRALGEARGRALHGGGGRARLPEPRRRRRRRGRGAQGRRHRARARAL